MEDYLGVRVKGGGGGGVVMGGEGVVDEKNRGSVGGIMGGVIK
jgi:hypothetical protein